MDNFIHIPVLLAETLATLAPRPAGRYADGTIGMGGHAAAILQASAPTGTVWGCDRDGAALEAATERLRPFAGRFELRRGNFADLADWVPAASCDGIVLDLGVSSPQLDRPERGFSFQHDGPLDMRMDDRQRLTAADLVNETETAELVRLFRNYGDEPSARKIARAITEARMNTPFQTTRQLADFIGQVCPRHGARKHPATRVFQALRIAVNDELGALERGLDRVFGLLKPGGRLAVITFHSLEDRLVKEFGRQGERDYDITGPVDVPELRRPRAPRLRRLNRKAICPGEAELRHNPRARSAQLRVMERI